MSIEARELIIEDITSLMVKIDRFLSKEDPSVLMANGLLATAQHLLDISGGNDGDETEADSTAEREGEGGFPEDAESNGYHDESGPEYDYPESIAAAPAAAPTRSLADDMGIGFEEGAAKLRSSKPRRPASSEPAASRRPPSKSVARPGSRRPVPSSNGPSRPRRNLADEWAGPLPKRNAGASPARSQPATPPAAETPPPSSGHPVQSRRKAPPTVPASGVCVGCNGYYGGGFHPTSNNYPLLNGQVAAVVLCDGRAVYPIGGVPSTSPGE